MLDILKVVYRFEDHAATTLEISLVRNYLGFPGEKSYNSLIAQNGKRVKEYLKKDVLLDKNGEESYWGIFFDGDKLDGRTTISTDVKVGKSFGSGGWTLQRNDIKEILPIEEYQGTYPITVDGIKAEGRFNVDSRLFFKSESFKTIS